MLHLMSTKYTLFILFCIHSLVFVPLQEAFAQKYPEIELLKFSENRRQVINQNFLTFFRLFFSFFIS